MDISQKYSTLFRRWRSRQFFSLAKRLLSLGITANLLTFLSLLAGLTAVYFLFANQRWFIIFALTHLVLDALDGVLARASEETTFGKYFDYGADTMVAFLLLTKTVWFLQDYYGYIVLVLFVLANLFYIISKCTLPLLFVRTLVITLLLLPYSVIPLLVVMAAGVASLFSLALQLRYILTLKLRR